MTDTKLKNIAIVGVVIHISQAYLYPLNVRQASSKIGTATLKYLFQRDSHTNVTIIIRDASTATFPSSPQIFVKKGSFEDPEFLQSAFQGSELAVLVINVFAMDVEQPRLIDAAAKVVYSSPRLIVSHADKTIGWRQKDHSRRVSNVYLSRPWASFRPTHTCPRFGGDNMNPDNPCLRTSFMVPKLAALKQIEDRGLKWVGVETNPCIEMVNT